MILQGQLSDKGPKEVSSFQCGVGFESREKPPFIPRGLWKIKGLYYMLLGPIFPHPHAVNLPGEL